ncbi:MAG: hypothetical protein WCG48_02770 [Candidatus Berkelbacteria bacterium]
MPEILKQDLDEQNNFAESRRLEDIVFVNLGIENDASAQEYYCAHEVEIEASLSDLVDWIVKYFNDNYTIEIHPEAIPGSQQIRRNTFQGACSRGERINVDKLVAIIPKSGDQQEFSRSQFIERAIEKFFEEKGSLEIVEQMSQSFGGLHQGLSQYAKNIAHERIYQELDKEDLRVGLEIIHQMMAEEMDTRIEDARERPIFWVHGLPIENVPGIFKSGAIISQKELVSTDSRHKAYSPASLKGTFSERGIKKWHHDNIYGTVEQFNPQYTGYVPGVQFKTAKEAYDWRDVHRNDPEYLYQDEFGTVHNWPLSAEPLRETYEDSDYAIHSTPVWDVYFFKPIQMISEEAKVSSSLLKDNDRGGGVSFQGHISMEGGRFFVQSEKAREYLIANGIPEKKILMFKNPYLIFLFHYIGEKQRLGAHTWKFHRDFKLDEYKQM